MHKRLIIGIAALMAVLITGQSPVFSQWNRPSTPNDSLISTEALASGEVVFRIYAPEAKEVSVGGDAIPWGQQIEGKKADNGVWSFTVPDIKPGTYRYHFVVDGVRVYDPISSEFGSSPLLSHSSTAAEFSWSDSPLVRKGIWASFQV